MTFVLPENFFPATRQLIQLADISEGKMRPSIASNILPLLVLVHRLIMCFEDTHVILLCPIEVNLLSKHPYTLLKN